MKLSCGIFGLAHELEDDRWGTLQQLKDIGFTAIEPIFAFENDPVMMPDSPLPAFLRAITWNEEMLVADLPRLKEIGLTVSSLHVGFLFGATLSEGIPQMIRLAQKTGIRHFYTSLEFDTPDKTEKAIQFMNEAQAMLMGSNVTLGYHNHCMEFKTMAEGMNYMDYFLAHTVPEVKIELDVGWQMYGGNDIVSFIKRYGDRISAIHLKDFVCGFNGIPQDDAFAALGDGVLPINDILNLIPSLSLIDHGLMIDQDKASKEHQLLNDLRNGMAFLSAAADTQKEHK